MFVYDLIEQREADNQPRDKEGKYDTTGAHAQPASVVKANYSYKKGDLPGSKMKPAPKNVTSKGFNPHAEYIQSKKTGNIFKNPDWSGAPEGRGQVALNGKVNGIPNMYKPLTDVSADTKYLATGKVPPKLKSPISGQMPTAPKAIVNPVPASVKATMPLKSENPSAPLTVLKGVKPTRLISSNPTAVESEEFAKRVTALWEKQQKEVYKLEGQGFDRKIIDSTVHNKIGKGRAITEGEKEAIRSYSQSGFTSMNQELRDKNKIDAIERIWVKNQAEAASDYLNSQVIREEIALVRNINEANLTKLLQVGDEVYDPAFISTSTRNGVFSSYGSVEMRIRVPAGTRGRSIRKWSRHKGEDEVLLPPGATFRVMHREVVGLNGDKVRLYVDLIDQGLRPDAAILGRSLRAMSKDYWIGKDQVQKFTTDLADGGVAVNGIFPSGKILTDGQQVKRGLTLRAQTYKPTAGMKEEARKGLEWRKEFGRGGTAIGVARARDIINDSNFPLETVKRVYSFFSRHEVDKKAEGFRPGEKGFPSAGRVAWALWGGDAGFSWSRKIVGSAKVEKNMSIRALPDNYRPASSEDVPAERNCGNCAYYGNGYCDFWDEPVAENYYCNAWDGETADDTMEMSETDNLIAELKVLLANSDAVYHQAHGYHWNVRGQDFSQYHALFEMIYTDIYGSIDPLAENILKLQSDAPFRLQDLLSIASIQIGEIADFAPPTMAKELLFTLDALVYNLKEVFECADEAGEQGIANFIGERIDATQKWVWQLRASLDIIEQVMPEPDEPAEPEEDSWNPEMRKDPKDLKTGDFVSWGASGGNAFGKIIRIERDGKIDVPDSSFTITGTPDNPAALIRVYRKEESKAVATDVKVGHKFSTLTKIDSPNE